MKEGAVLVTGVGGLIGAAVLRQLVADGIAVVAADRTRPPDLDLEGMAVPFLAHDLPDPQRWHDAILRFGVRRIVHAGGVSGPMLLRDNPSRVCEINLSGLAGLLEAARIHRLGRIVWFSSIVAYGSRPDLAPVDEDTPLRPDTVYGATKAAGEVLIQAYHAEHGVDAAALRVASCYGAGRTTSCMIRTLIEDGLVGRVSRIHPAMGRTRQHVFIDDVVGAVRGALDAPALRQRVYNIGPGCAQDLQDIVEQIRTAVPAAEAVLDPQGPGLEHVRPGAARHRCRSARSRILARDVDCRRCGSDARLGH
jgi:nucleoside-diphosphate-sugar epimerase